MGTPIAHDLGMNNLRLIASLSLILGTAALAPGCTDDNGVDATLTVENRSDFDIVDLRVALSGGAYGDNLLRGDQLQPGESIDLGVRCETYDARLIDDSGVDCEVLDLDLCLNDARWVIRNDTCTTFGAARAAREAAAKAAAANPSSAPATTL